MKLTGTTDGVSVKEFVTQARIALADPETLIAAFCEHMVEHGAEVETSGDERIVRFTGSHALISHDADAIHVNASAGSLEDLYFLRLTVASHIIELAQDEAPIIAWTGDGNETERPPNFQILEVQTVRDVTPHMRRITFSCENVSRFDSMSALHLNIMIQHPDLSEPQWPRVGCNGLVAWEDPDHRPSLRKYTVRALDLAAGTLDIDFVLHADAGPGSAFAEAARPGDRIGIFGPGGGGLVEAHWYLLAGDETALPAISRILEHLPATARGTALIEVADPSEIQEVEPKAAILIEWLCRNGSAPGALLTEAVRRVHLPGDGTRVFVWAGCEFDAFRDIRAYLRKERGLTKHEHLVVSYWRNGKSEDQAQADG
jgi:NADPH-dependent ferric siderophore reductase